MLIRDTRQGSIEPLQLCTSTAPPASEATPATLKRFMFIHPVGFGECGESGESGDSGAQCI